MKKLFALLTILLPLSLLGASPPFPLLANANAVSGGSSLSDVAAFFPLNEQVTGTGGSNRLDTVTGLVWLDKNQNVFAIRGIHGGAIQGGNNASDGLFITNSIFDQGSGKSFTCVFWACGGNGGVLGEWDASAGNAADWWMQVGGANNLASAFCFDHTGTLKQATTTNTPTAGGRSGTVAFQMLAFGFDNTAQQFWVSCNATPKNPTSCTDVRATGGRGFICIPHLACVDNVGYWRRTLTQTELTNLFNGGFSDTYPFNNTPGQQVADTYGWAVTNSGGTISSTTYSATKTLCQGLYTDGVLARFSSLLGFPNETLNGALQTIVCPYYFQGVGRGIEPCIDPYSSRHNFVNGDVSVNGVAGNGSSKWTALAFNTTSTADDCFITNMCDSGAVIYCYTASSSGVEFAAEDGFASPQFDFGFKVNSTTFNGSAHTTQCWWGYDNSTCYASSALAGYYSVQRDTQSSLALYFANSTHAHAAVMTTNATMTSCSQSRSTTFPLWCYYDGNLCGGCTFSANTISVFGSLFSHLSSSDSANVYARFQTYRTSIGGGFQ